MRRSNYYECPICGKLTHEVHSHWKKYHENEIPYDEYMDKIQGGPHYCRYCGKRLMPKVVTRIPKFCNTSCQMSYQMEIKGSEMVRRSTNSRKLVKENKELPTYPKLFESSGESRGIEGLTKEEVICKNLGLEEVPRCPICGDYVKIYNNVTFTKTCGKVECHRKLAQITAKERNVGFQNSETQRELGLRGRKSYISKYGIPFTSEVLDRGHVYCVKVHHDYFGDIVKIGAGNTWRRWKCLSLLEPITILELYETDSIDKPGILEFKIQSKFKDYNLELEPCEGIFSENGKKSFVQNNGFTEWFKPEIWDSALEEISKEKEIRSTLEGFREYWSRNSMKLIGVEDF